MQHNVRHAEFGAGLCCVRGHGRRERMGGIDNSGDVVVDKPVTQSLDATEATDPDQPGRQRRIGHPTGQ